jgi:hypothetical protein
MCCGAGGARMWMEERIGQRINVTRTTEAIETLDGAGMNGAGGTIAVGCPFCRTMIGDGLTQKQSEGSGEGVQVQDVAQLLLAAVKRGDAPEKPAEAADDATEGDVVQTTETPLTEHADASPADGDKPGPDADPETTPVTADAAGTDGPPADTSKADVTTEMNDAALKASDKPGPDEAKASPNGTNGQGPAASSGSDDPKQEDATK